MSERTEPDSGVTFVNATPHDITLIQDADRKVLPASGLFARVGRERLGVSRVQGVSASGDHIDVDVVALQSTDQVDGLPAPSPGVVYVVPQLTALAASNRDDVVFPYDEVRDATGRLIGVRGFARFVD